MLRRTKNEVGAAQQVFVHYSFPCMIKGCSTHIAIENRFRGVSWLFQEAKHATGVL
jgi:hypothetical protein